MKLTKVRHTSICLWWASCTVMVPASPNGGFCKDLQGGTGDDVRALTVQSFGYLLRVVYYQILDDRRTPNLSIGLYVCSVR